MTYDLSNFNATNSNTLLDLTTRVSSHTPIFGLLLLIAIFLGYYMLFSKEQNINDLLASSFITSIVATLMMFANIITWPIYIACLFIFIAIFIMKWYMT